MVRKFLRYPFDDTATNEFIATIEIDGQSCEQPVINLSRGGMYVQDLNIPAGTVLSYALDIADEQISGRALSRWSSPSGTGLEFIDPSLHHAVCQFLLSRLRALAMRDLVDPDFTLITSMQSIPDAIDEILERGLPVIVHLDDQTYTMPWRNILKLTNNKRFGLNFSQQLVACTPLQAVESLDQIRTRGLHPELDYIPIAIDSSYIGTISLRDVAIMLNEVFGIMAWLSDHFENGSRYAIAAQLTHLETLIQHCQEEHGRMSSFLDRAPMAKAADALQLAKALLHS